NCEVKVGRIPYYGTIADLDSILQKIITYETATGDQSWRQKLLAPAAVSNFVEDRDNDGVVDTTPATMGDSWGEALKTLATTNSFSAYTLYEKTGCKSDGTAYPLTACNVALTQANIQSEWLNHYGFVTWWGHGSSTGASRVCWTSDTVRADNICQVNTSESTWYNMWNSSNCSALNDSYPSYVVQVSCNNGWPENTGNLGYSLLKNGAIGTVSASRVSWYAVANWYTGLYSSCGDNASYGYRIFERMSGSSEDVGTALNWCRGNFGTAWGYNSWMNKLDFNLYGDPSTSFATQTPGITVTAPTSASSWKAGTTQGVTWTATGVTGNVYIILYNGWTQERVLATVPASSGSYGWAIPFGQTPDTDYRIRVKSVSTPSLDDYSDAFAITQSPLRLTSPTAASSWNAGAPQTVSWATDGTLVGDVYICLFRGWAYQRTLKMTPVSSGSWTWNVPSYELVGTDYRIRLKSALSPAVQDFSDQFSINQARIAVTAPGPSALWEAGAPHSITWTTDGTITGNVYICLYDGWTRVRTLAMTTAASGSWTWNIPSHETVKANYHIRVKSASEPTVRDFSGTFAIAQPKIQITAPTGGPSWTAGTPQDITWNTDGSIGGNVYICLYSNWTHQRTLATVPAADGTWSWSIPSGETPGTTYRIRVKSVDQPTIRDYTDLFTVASP
ncbi:MAG: hypothetical protein GY851_04250, partial [bacterium]|nr:hypothetical protein [bacterium]